jgi:hypothetical protein
MARAAFGRLGVQQGWTAMCAARVDGCFLTGDPELFELHAATLAAARDRATRAGIAGDRIDDLVRDIRAAKDGGYEWVSSPFYLDLALRKPTVT